MLALYDDRQRLHQPLTRMAGGSLKPSPETPARIDMLLEGLVRAGVPIAPPREHGMAAIEAIHDRAYIEFLRTGFDIWRKNPANGPEMRASAHPTDRMNRLPEDILGRTGYYQADASVVLLDGTWQAVLASANTAIDAMSRLLSGELKQAYALCRPPGHHAYADKGGGFCYLNNAGIAADMATRQGRRVAVLDVDVHHGNGTQILFYDRADILTVSVHGDPAHLYPFYAGYADETGNGAGRGFNRNLPVPLLSGNAVYLDAVSTGRDAVAKFKADMLVVTLGLDAAVNDPFQCMKVDDEGFASMGRLIGEMRLPTLLVQEGGYPQPGLSASLAAFLAGFQAPG